MSARLACIGTSNQSDGFTDSAGRNMTAARRRRRSRLRIVNSVGESWLEVTRRPGRAIMTGLASTEWDSFSGHPLAATARRAGWQGSPAT